MNGKKNTINFKTIINIFKKWNIIIIVNFSYLLIKKIFKAVKYFIFENRNYIKKKWI